MHAGDFDLPEKAHLGPPTLVTPEERAAKALVVATTIDRVEQTYQDVIAENKGFEQIPPFFRNHLYSPANKEARDAALDNLYEKLRSITGPEMTENVHQLILLNKLTDELDLLTARLLLRGPLKGVGEPQERGLSHEELAKAMSAVGRFEDRRRQIDMIGESLNFFFSLSKLPLIKLVMAPIKVAASLVGAMPLVETMEAGYVLSRNIKNMGPFIEVFTEREYDLIDGLEKKK